MAVYTKTWIPEVPLGIFAVTYVGVIIVLNLFGVANLGKAEAGMSLVKSLVLVAFIVTAGLVLAHVFGPGHTMGWPLIGRSGGVFPHGFGSVFQAMLIVIFSYAGVTTVAMATSRARHARHTVPRAAWYTTIGVVALYAVSVAGLVSLVDYSQLSPHQSPFVTVLNAYHFLWFSRAFNAVILIASFSVMAGTFYATEWMLISMALQRGAPQLFRHSGSGRPYPALTATAALVLSSLVLAFVLPRSVYTDLTAASSYFSFVNWLLILLAFVVWHTRARRAGQTVSRLAWGAPYGSAVMAAAIVVLGFYSVSVPSFRLGFVVFCGLTLAILASWFVRARRRAKTA